LLRYYRLYFLDSADRIRQAIDMECDDDATAIEAAEPYRDGRTMELWNRDRLVQRFANKSESKSAPAEGSPA
jgi:hypothetical protein